MLRRALLATLLVSATVPVLTAKERILLNRIGPSNSTLFIAKAERLRRAAAAAKCRL